MRVLFLAIVSAALWFLTITTIVALTGCSVVECIQDHCLIIIEPTPRPTATPQPTPPVATPTPRPTTTPQPKKNPICTAVMPAQDGPGGFVLKNGDHTGLVVVLLPGRFSSQFDSVTIERLNGSRESLRFAGWANPDHGIGDRQHWRGTRKVADYQPGSQIIAKEVGNECRWQLPTRIVNNRVD